MPTLPLTPAQALTPKQERFVEAYLANNGNGTQAAIAAGYGQKSAHVTASRLIRLPKVRNALIEHTDLILAQAAPFAAQRLHELIRHKSGYVSLEAAKDVLNRNRIGAGDAGAQRSPLVVNISIPDARGPHGPIVDVTPGGSKRRDGPVTPPPRL
jgi:phage terminase small subunit